MAHLPRALRKMAHHTHPTQNYFKRKDASEARQNCIEVMFFTTLIHFLVANCVFYFLFFIFSFLLRLCSINIVSQYVYVVFFLLTERNIIMCLFCISRCRILLIFVLFQQHWSKSKTNKTALESLYIRTITFLLVSSKLN